MQRCQKPLGGREGRQQGTRAPVAAAPAAEQQAPVTAQTASESRTFITCRPVSIKPTQQFQLLSGTQNQPPEDSRGGQDAHRTRHEVGRPEALVLKEPRSRPPASQAGEKGRWAGGRQGVMLEAKTATGVVRLGACTQTQGTYRSGRSPPERHFPGCHCLLLQGLGNTELNTPP